MDTFDSDGQPEYEIRQFNFNNVPETNEFKDFRLKAFKTPDGWEYVSTWRDIYRSFCLYVYNHKPKHIKALKDLGDTFLSKNVIFASDSDNLYDAFRIKYNLFVEQRLSSSGIVDIITKLIYYCRLPARYFIVRYEAPVSEEALAEEEPELDSTLEAPNISHYFSLDNPPVLKNSGAKPCSIKIGSNISSWREILVEIVKYIDLYYPDKLDELLRIYGPKGKRFILAKSKNSFFKSSYTKEPQKVRNGLFVKGDLTSDDIIQIAISFLVFCDIDPSQVLIEYRPKGEQTTLDNTFSIDVNNISDVEPAPELEETEEENSELDDNDPEEDELEEDGEDKEFDNDLVNNDVDNSENFKDDKEFNFNNVDDFVDIGMEFTDNGLPVLSPAHQKLIDEIEETFPKGIDIDNEDSVRTLELASGVPCNKYTLEDLRMILAYNKADNVFYVPKRLADESTVKSMAAFIDQNVNQYNAVSLSVIREKFQDQFDCECNDEELLEFIEWYVFREMDQVVAIDYSDVDGDGVCLPRSITTDEFCENFYGQIESYLEKADCPVPMSQLRQLYPSLSETIISYALSDDLFGSSIQEETKDEQLLYSIRSNSQLNDDAADEQEPEPECKILSFTLDDPIPDLKHSKPTSVSFGELMVPISSWAGVLPQTAIYIDQNEPDAFNALVKQYGDSGSGLRLFSRAQFVKQSCKQIKSDCYLNTNFSAADTVKQAQLLMQSCQLPLSEVRIEYFPGRANGSVGAPNLKTDNNSAPSSQQTLAELTKNPPELTPELQTLLKTIEEKFPRGINLEDSKNILENASGVQCTDEIIDDLTYFLFENSDGLFYLPSQIADESTLNDMAEFIDQQIKQYGAVATSVVRDKFRYRLKFINEELGDLGDFIVKFINPKLDQKINSFNYQKDNYYICIPQSVTEEQFDKDVSLRIKQFLEEKNKAVKMYELCDKFPYLDEDILDYFLDDDDYVDDVLCVYNEDEDVYAYRTIDSLYLEDDFSEALTDAVAQLEANGGTATLATIAAKLDEHYNLESENGQSAFREQYELTDDDAFRYVVRHCYAGEVKHKWGTKTRFVPEKSTGTINLYDEFKKQYPISGVFDENLFFEFAKKKTGYFNTAAMALAYLRPHCIRLDIDHWIDIQPFKEQSNFSPELASAIAERLTQQLGSRPFLSLGLLSDSFFEELPELRINDKLWQWNKYLLTSVSALLIDDLAIVNEEPNANLVTALLLPASIPIPKDIIEYAVKCYQQQNGDNISIGGAIEFLKQNLIRMKRTTKLEQQLEELLKER